MKHLMAKLLAALFCAVAVSAQEQSSINPASSYAQVAGVTVVSPNQSGWTLLKSDTSETVFEKRDKDEILNAHVKIMKTKTFETEKDLLIGLETLKQDELSKFKVDSIHFNNTRFKGSQCLQYDGIFTTASTSSPKFKYFNLIGYLCPRPKTTASAVQIEFSSYSNSRGFSEDLLSLSDEFFEKIVFSKALTN